MAAVVLSCIYLFFAISNTAAATAAAPTTAAGEAISSSESVESQGLPFSCRWTATDGTSYDLSSLTKSAGQPDYSGTDGVFDYKLNVCGSSSFTGCSSREAGTCQVDRQTQTSSLMFGYYGMTPQPTWSQIDAANPGAGVQMVFINGERCPGIGQGTQRTVTVKYVCSESTSPTFEVKSGAAMPQCTYEFTLNTPAGCPATSSKSGLSGGSVFLIILLVGTTLYISIGCVYKAKTLGTSGVESCPNIAFWKTIPGYVLDGCRYTKRKLMSGRGDSYQQV